jgi:hypothetical protein
MIDESYQDLRVQADQAEKKARADDDQLSWMKVMAIRGEMMLRHAESYNGFPGAESDSDDRNGLGRVFNKGDEQC